MAFITLTDPSGLPLDAAGVNTPGVVSLAFVAAYIPKGQEQYVAYTTEQSTGAVLGTITRPFFELGSGPGAQVAPGQYQYTFKATAPAGFDPTVTTTVAVDGNRNLTSFNLGTSYAGTTFNFVPNGSAVTVTRDVIGRRVVTPVTTNWLSTAGMPPACGCASFATPAKRGSGHRQQFGRQGLFSQASYGIAVAQRHWHRKHARRPLPDYRVHELRQ